MDPTTKNTETAMTLEEISKFISKQSEVISGLNEVISKQNEASLKQKEEFGNIKKTLDAVLETQAKQNAQIQLSDTKRNISETKLNNLSQQVAEEIQGRKWKNIGSGTYTMAKIVTKIGGKEIIFSVVRLFSTEMAKTSSKICGKVLPFAGLGIGVFAGGYRLYKGQYLKAGIEVASGSLSLIPVIGTIISVVIDALLGLHDIYACDDSPVSVDHTLTLEEAYKALTIESKDPTKEEVDQAYRSVIPELHSDIIKQSGNEKLIEDGDEITSFATACKEFIYSERGW